MKPVIWLIPGLLGDSSHFGELPQLLGDCQLVSPLQFSDSSTLAEAAGNLAQLAIASGVRPHLVGYSLGGRLALQAGIMAPNSFASITALSAHPGLQNTDERARRIIEDRHWAQELRRNFASFWKEWCQRAVLKDSPEPSLGNVDEAQRKNWANILEKWSTSQQLFFPPLLAASPAAYMHVVGSEDTAYVTHQSIFPENVKKVVVPTAGHRIPLQKPHELAALITPFLRENP